MHPKDKQERENIVHERSNLLELFLAGVYASREIKQGIKTTINIKSGMTIPEQYPYAGFIVTKVSKNGWCRGYYPSNVKDGDIKAASTAVRAHWLVGVNVEYNIIADEE